VPIQRLLPPQYKPGLVLSNLLMCPMTYPNSSLLGIGKEDQLRLYVSTTVGLKILDDLLFVL